MEADFAKFALQSSSATFDFTAQPGAALHYQVHLASVPLTYQSIANERRIAELGALGDDWDGYGAAAISSAAVRNAKQWFCGLANAGEQPEINPNTNGTISFEWETSQGNAHLEIGDSEYSFYLVTQTGQPFFLKGPVEESTATYIGDLVYKTLYKKSGITPPTVANASSRFALAIF